jgi:hypothetical protein
VKTGWHMSAAVACRGLRCTAPALRLADMKFAFQDRKNPTNALRIHQHEKF